MEGFQVRSEGPLTRPLRGSVTVGCAKNSALKLSRQAAAKTGTTEDYRDSWIEGYTPNLAVGVWVGNNDNRQMAKVAGARGAGPIWHNFFEGVFASPQMEQVLLQTGETSLATTFAEPPGMVRADVSAISGLCSVSCAVYRPSGVSRSVGPCRGRRQFLARSWRKRESPQPIVPDARVGWRENLKA